MKKTKSKAAYINPEMKVVVITPRKVMCQSGLQDYKTGDEIPFES